MSEHSTSELRPAPWARVAFSQICDIAHRSYHQTVCKMSHDYTSVDKLMCHTIIPVWIN